MPLDDMVFKHQYKQSAQGSGGSRWKPEEGQLKFRLFPMQHKVTSEDVKVGLLPKERLGKTIALLGRPVSMQFGISSDGRPVLANAKTIAMYKKLASSSNAQDVKRAQSIRPQNKFVVNLVDTMVNPPAMLYWMMPKTVFHSVQDSLRDPEAGGEDSILGSKGRDFVMKYDKKAKPNIYKVALREGGKSSKLSTELEKMVVDYYSPAGFDSLGILTEPTAAAPEAEEEEAPAEVEEEEEVKKEEDVDEEDLL